MPNCKPGDLAVIVRESKGYEENIGAFVTVTKLRQVMGGVSVWEFTNPSKPLKGFCPYTGKVAYSRGGDSDSLIPDIFLRPIRPQKKAEMQVNAEKEVCHA